MRSALIAVSIAAFTLAGPAAAQQAGQAAAAPFPLDVQSANGPSQGETNGLFGAPNVEGGVSAMSRLRQVCAARGSQARATCAKAWREINAAYAATHARPGTTRSAD